MSLKMAHKVILPPKKNYIPQFLKQRDINSYYFRVHSIYAQSLSPLTKSPGTVSHSVNVNLISTTVIAAEGFNN
jgi:hypothetical protein